MQPEDFEVGSKVVLNYDNVFRDDVFTVVGHTDACVCATVVVFGRTINLEIPPDLLRPAPESGTTRNPTA
jgi:hypothetical protein